MNVRNLKQPIRAIGTKIKNLRIEKHQNEINKYVNITPGENDKAYEQIFTAQEMLANYAKAKNVKINIHDAETSGGKLINIEVTKPNHTTLGECVNADTKLILNAERDNTVLLEDKDGLNHIVKSKITSEDSFLKNIYRIVENFTNI